MDKCAFDYSVSNHNAEVHLIICMYYSSGAYSKYDFPITPAKSLHKVGVNIVFVSRSYQTDTSSANV